MADMITTEPPLISVNDQDTIVYVHGPLDHECFLTRGSASEAKTRELRNRIERENALRSSTIALYLIGFVATAGLAFIIFRGAGEYPNLFAPLMYAIAIAMGLFSFFLLFIAAGWIPRDGRHMPDQFEDDETIRLSETPHNRKALKRVTPAERDLIFSAPSDIEGDVIRVVIQDHLDDIRREDLAEKRARDRKVAAYRRRKRSESLRAKWCPTAQ